MTPEEYPTMAGRNITVRHVEVRLSSGEIVRDLIMDEGMKLTFDFKSDLATHEPEHAGFIHWAVDPEPDTAVLNEHLRGLTYLPKESEADG